MGEVLFHGTVTPRRPLGTPGPDPASCLWLPGGLLREGPQVPSFRPVASSFCGPCHRVQLRVGWQLLSTQKGAPAHRGMTCEPPMELRHAVLAATMPRDSAVTHTRQRMSTSGLPSPPTLRTVRRWNTKGLRPEPWPGLADLGATTHGFPRAVGGNAENSSPRCWWQARV